MLSFNGVYTTHFSVKNGVEQGGVLSPLLLNLYLDDLIKELRMT